MATTHTTLRPGTYDDVHAQVEQLARGLDPHDYLAGTWLRELTVALALHDDLVVSVVTYDGGGQELEVRLASAPGSDDIVIGRGAGGAKPRSRWISGSRLRTSRAESRRSGWPRRS